jgi:hypothetical protein
VERRDRALIIERLTGAAVACWTPTTAPNHAVTVNVAVVMRDMRSHLQVA